MIESTLLFCDDPRIYKNASIKIFSNKINTKMFQSQCFVNMKNSLQTFL